MLTLILSILGYKLRAKNLMDEEPVSVILLFAIIADVIIAFLIFALA